MMAASSLLLHSISPANFPINFKSTAAIKQLIKCTQIDEPNFPSPPPDSISTTSSDKFPIEKRRRSAILRERKSQTGIAKPDPPDYEIGWKRTKKINVEKTIGYLVIDYLEKLEGLMERELFRSTELLAKTGEIVAERVREEEILREEGKVEERIVIGLFRVLKLMEMDLAMLQASVKQDTFIHRLRGGNGFERRGRDRGGFFSHSQSRKPMKWTGGCLIKRCSTSSHGRDLEDGAKVQVWAPSFSISDLALASALSLSGCQYVKLLLKLNSSLTSMMLSMSSTMMRSL